MVLSATDRHSCQTRTWDVHLEGSNGRWEIIVVMYWDGDLDGGQAYAYCFPSPGPEGITSAMYFEPSGVVGEWNAESIARMWLFENGEGA